MTDDFVKKLPRFVREETRPEFPVWIRWKTRLFGRQHMLEYLWSYYQNEAGKRSPFYLPCIYMKEEFDFLRRYAGIPQKQIKAVLIDANDARSDCFLEQFLGQLNYLTIVSERKAYFEGLAERAFSELGLLIDLVFPWEEKALHGNLVWDFSKELQKSDCYPPESICFVPSKPYWKCREILNSCPSVTLAAAPAVLIGGREFSAELAEAMLVKKDFPFRQSRCEELRHWCGSHGWHIKMNPLKLDSRTEAVFTGERPGYVDI